ncbi:MAG: dTMP kinase [Actinomycetota bacterium]|nr:dTMP kinase [Actinomycetota bacterium]
MRNGNFLRFFLAQFVSSLGDWIGVIAIAVFANKIRGPAAVGMVLTARVLPGFIMGPIGGVIADRWDRKKTMVVADLIRAAIIFSLPFFPNLLYLLIASVALESLTLVWGPAKDASLPHFVKPSELTHANSLSLIGVYAPWPVASLVYASLATFGVFLGRTVPALEGLTENTEALALWMDSLTFAFSAVMVATLTIPTTVNRAGHLDLKQIRRDLFEGLRFVVKHKQVRPWMLGIAFTFTAAGAVFSLGIGFVQDVLGGGDRGFAFLVGFLGTGMIIGLLAVGVLARFIQKDVLFSSSILLSGASLIGLASMNSLDTAIPLASTLGFFGGAAYSTAYSLMHENTTDELRGRTFSAAYTVIRIGTLLGLGIFPLIASALGDNTIAGVAVPGSRGTLWLAGLVAIGGGLVSMRAIGERSSQPTLVPAAERGSFIVFEGGEGAGKTTQMEALVRWLEARGEGVVTTREPGGTSIGNRIRDILLDPSAADMDARAEALLYAADRAQHVKDVILPALRAGKTVVSDRFVDSSLAYQGAARGLGIEEIYRISEWATGGLLPDVVFYLDIDPETGLGRIEQEPDRIESEKKEFHEKVSRGYLQLAQRFSSRFVVLDANRSPAQIHARVLEVLSDRNLGRVVSLSDASRTIGRPGPLPR